MALPPVALLPVALLPVARERGRWILVDRADCTMNDRKKSLSNVRTAAPELLAPAGDRDCLDAALQAGADAVYFGLRTLNARRGAKNFLQDELAAAVGAAHDRGARAYLTLNTDISEREIGQAARILELARQSGVDAVLVRDPALLSMKPHFPEIEFHFSTQTCITNSADSAAAAELGIPRVVLAREMSLSEIAAASAVPGVETEVFVQGALCFSVSGRCLLSSWAGGRSGNRGTCTSPCRVAWSLDGGPAEPLFSMHDLGAIDRLEALRAAGVRALKIEGRLKSARWVGRAVSLYRQALALAPAPALATTTTPQTPSSAPGATEEESRRLVEDAASLGEYAGRRLTSAYLDGTRNELTGDSGRPAGGAASAAASHEESPSGCVACVEDGDDAACNEDVGADVAQEESELLDSEASDFAEPSGRAYHLEIRTTTQAIECCFRAGLYETRWTMPKTVVRRVRKAISVGDFLNWLGGQDVQGYVLEEGVTDDPAFLVVPRASNALMDRIQAAVRHVRKSPDSVVRVELPEPVRRSLEKDSPHASNRRTLGQPANRVRLSVEAVSSFLKRVHPDAVILEGVTLRSAEHLADTCGASRPIVALPAVFFENAVREVTRLVHRCAKLRLSVEVNSWGGWRLAREAGATMEAGPGLGVLNSLAARTLRGLGLRGVTASMEADRQQLEDLSAHCASPLSIVVFGRPVLATTRVEFNAGRFLGATLADRRGIRLVPRIERGLWVFRPDDPFDLRAIANPRITAANLVVDLAASDDPLGDWYSVPSADDEPFAFNYHRSLA